MGKGLPRSSTPNRHPNEGGRGETPKKGRPLGEEDPKPLGPGFTLGFGFFFLIRFFFFKVCWSGGFGFAYIFWGV